MDNNLIERIIKYEKKWNMDIFNNMYKSDKDAIAETKDKIENHPEYLIQDFALDLDGITRNATKINHKQFKEQLEEIYAFLIEIHNLFYGSK